MFSNVFPNIHKANMLKKRWEKFEVAKGLGPSLLALNIEERVHEPRSIGTAVTNRQQTGDLNPTTARD